MKLVISIDSNNIILQCASVKFGHYNTMIVQCVHCLPNLDNAKVFL